MNESMNRLLRLILFLLSSIYSVVFSFLSSRNRRKLNTLPLEVAYCNPIGEKKNRV